MRAIIVATAVFSLTFAPGPTAQAQDLPADAIAVSPADAVALNLGRLYRLSSWQPNSPPLPPGMLFSIPGMEENGVSTNAVYFSPSAAALFVDDRAAVASQMLSEVGMNQNQMMLQEDEEGGEMGEGYTGGLWLEPVQGVSNVFNVLLHGATNGSYYLVTSTEYLDPATDCTWLVEGWLQAGADDPTPFAVGLGARTNNLFIRAQACDDACAATNLPLAWQLKYFGNTAVLPEGDLDGDGVSNLSEYLNGTDPNKISFVTDFTNDHVNGNSANGNFEILTGVPAQMAILVNSTNFTDADWLSFSQNFTASLPSADGRYDVWIGLRGLAPASQQTWDRTVITRDTLPPVVVITNPAPGTTSRPIIRLQGYSPEPLASITFDLVNEAGTATNQPGFVTAQYFDPGTRTITTNWFECTDVELTNGLNTITLRVTDLAGNVTTTNLLYTFDTNGDVTPPAVALYWPQDGDAIAATNFTVRGWLDDPTAQVVAQIVGADGVTNAVEAIVERNGLFWAEDLPLPDGASTVILSATDAAGNVATTNITVTKSAVQLTIGDLPETASSSISVSGTISSDGYSVWVNGIQASVDGTTWSAGSVLLPDGGTALVQVRAIPSSDSSERGTGGSRTRAIPNTGSGGSSSSYNDPGNPNSPNVVTAEAQRDKPPSIIMLSCYYSWTNWSRDLGDEGSESTIIPWSRNQETDGTYVNELHDLLGDYSAVTSYVWPACKGEGDCLEGTWTCVTTDNGVVSTTSGAGLQQPVLVMEHREDIQQTVLPAPVNYAEVMGYKNQTILQLQTGGKAKSKRQSLFTISATAARYRSVWDVTPVGITATDIVFPSLGRLGSDGLLHVVLPDNQTRDVTVKTPYKAYSFTVGQQKYKSRFTIYVDMPDPNGCACYVDGNWGHAWWQLDCDAPANATSKFISADCAHFLGDPVGYYPTNYTTDSTGSGPGMLLDPETDTANFSKPYDIGFPDLLNALKYTRGVANSPGEYNAILHNCVEVLQGATSAAGVPLPPFVYPEELGVYLQGRWSWCY